MKLLANRPLQVVKSGVLGNTLKVIKNRIGEQEAYKPLKEIDFTNLLNPITKNLHIQYSKNLDVLNISINVLLEEVNQLGNESLSGQLNAGIAQSNKLQNLKSRFDQLRENSIELDKMQENYLHIESLIDLAEYELTKYDKINLNTQLKNDHDELLKTLKLIDPKSWLTQAKKLTKEINAYFSESPSTRTLQLSEVLPQWEEKRQSLITKSQSYYPLADKAVLLSSNLEENECLPKSLEQAIKLTLNNLKENEFYFGYSTRVIENNIKYKGLVYKIVETGKYIGNSIVQILSPTKRFESKIESALLKFQNYTDQVQSAFSASGGSKEEALNYIWGLNQQRVSILELSKEISDKLSKNQSLDLSEQRKALNQSYKRNIDTVLAYYQKLLSENLSHEEIELLLEDLQVLENNISKSPSSKKRNEWLQTIKLINDPLSKQPLLLSAAPEQVFPNDFFDYFDEQDKVTVPVKDELEDSKWKFLKQRQTS